MISINHIFN